MSFRSGFVALLGKPNVGKSTLINTIIGEKAVITSNKPQTTRNVIRAILTESNTQMVFIDTPGIHRPKNKLGDYMVSVAMSTLSEVDVVFLLVDADNEKAKGDNNTIIEKLKKIDTPVFLLINKIDRVAKDKLLPMIDYYSNKMDFERIIPISSLKNEGVKEVIDEVRKFMPIGPKYFPEDVFVDQPERELVSEIIREKILYLVRDEIPHGVGVEVESFKTRENGEIIDISAVIYCEKNTHKAIIIGKNGAMLKKIGSLARTEVEALLGTKIFMELWVKVKSDWRNSNHMLKTLGYDKKNS